MIDRVLQHKLNALMKNTGLACSLLDIKTPEHVSSHFLRGGLFENLVVNEFIKASYNQGEKHARHLFLSRVLKKDRMTGKPVMRSLGGQHKKTNGSPVSSDKWLSCHIL